MTAYFITSTGTNIGKTYLTDVLVRQHKARAIKPIISGFVDDGKTDTHILAKAQGIKDISTVSPYRFSAALAPDSAGKREGKVVDLPTLVDFCRGTISNNELTFVEGVGGVMVPLTEKHTVLDWIAALRIPVILVAGSYLGTISHTLTAIVALRARQVPVHSIVISESIQNPMPMEETAASIERFCGIKPALLKRNAKTIELVL